MKTKAYAFVSMIAFAVISPVVAAGAVTVGLGAPTATSVEEPTYAETTVSMERVGVKTGATKRIIFSVHATAMSSKRFVVDFPYVANEPSYAKVTASAYNASNVQITSEMDCSSSLSGASNGAAGSCTFPPGTRKAIIAFSNPTGAASNAFHYRTYSTKYFQSCDNSTRRYCSTYYIYGTYEATFGSTTEERVGAIYQGDVDIFISSGAYASTNAPKAGDVVTLDVSSNVVINSSPENGPTLRVKAVNNLVESQIGHRYPCTSADSGAGMKWRCEIPSYDSVPNLTEYSSPRIVFSSSRNAPGATITITDATKETNILACNKTF